MLRKVTIACCGSVAIYSIPNLLILLRRAYDSELRVFLTSSAERFINPVGLSSVSGNQVVAASSLKMSDDELLSIMSGSTITLVAPASANTISQLAQGAAHSLAARVAMLSSWPVLLAPAMNERMWKHPATQRNLAEVRAASIYIVGPSSGLEVATFEPSASSMAPLDGILEKMLELAP